MPAAAVLAAVATNDGPGRLLLCQFRTRAGMMGGLKSKFDVLAFPQALLAGLPAYGPRVVLGSATCGPYIA